MHKRLESSVEKACTNWASAQGIICLKQTAFIGLPDKLFGFNGRVIFVEFKRPGEKLRPIQEYWYNLLRKQSFNVYVIDNLDSFKQIIKENFDA